MELGLPPKWEKPIKKILAIDQAETLYANLKSSAPADETPEEFCKRALKALNVSVSTQSLNQGVIDSIRQISGPIIIVANHPFGTLDALAFIQIMGELRKNFKFIGNAILTFFSELKPCLVPVAIMGTEKNPKLNRGKNILTMRALLKYLNDGGMVGFFPSGQVGFSELPWHHHLGQLVLKSNATVIPIYFGGRNRFIYYFFGFFFPALRVALLAREMLSYKKEIQFIIGDPLPFSKWSGKSDSKEITKEIQKLTMDLRKKLFTN